MSEWDRIQSVFLQALDQRPEERSAFLDRVCQGDLEIRREVESLLAHDDSGGDAAIVDALQDTTQSLLECEEDIGPLGPWRVIKAIGRGGMGRVYLAARDDDQFRKLVAVKLVKRGMDTSELLDRFRRERQILAQLDHPYISRLIDGGSTSKGQPFLVMEYVEGRPIDIYCHQDGLVLKDRLRLFLKVCEAVSYAHRNLVVHRDLKPGNILVSADGSPKLLDFGVATLLNPENNPSFTRTDAAGRLLTPEYASPEQMRGTFVSTASDIYALGAVLYELLTGAKAHTFDSRSPAEMERVICELPIRLPSERVAIDNPQLSKQLSGDLDNIILKAMRKEPEQRYLSVDLFAKDIGRYLDGMTVTARPPSVSYRFGKFARRNRIAVGFSALVVVSLVAGTWISLVQAHHARLAQQRAETRLAEMLDLANRALFDVHGSIERLPGAIEARKQLVRTTLQFLEKLSQDVGNDERLLRALGAAYLRLGDVQGYPYAANIGDFEGAIASYRKAGAFLDPLRRAKPADIELQRLWLEAKLHLAFVFSQQGDYKNAAQALRDGITAAAALEKMPGGGTDAEQLQATFYLQSAIVGDRAGIADLGDPLVNARRALALDSDLVARHPDNSEFISDQSDVFSFLGTLLQMKDARAALEEYLQCVKLREELVHSHPNDGTLKRSLMIGYGHVGEALGDPVLNNVGDAAGARAYYRKAVAIGEELYQADPSNSTAQFDFAAGMSKLGMLDTPLSEVPQSLTTLQKAGAMLESLVATTPKSVPRKRMLAVVLEYQGRRLQSLHRYREAIARYRQSLDVANSILALHASDRPGFSQLIASGDGMAEAEASAGETSAALQQAQATLARAEAGNEGLDERSHRRYVNEGAIELAHVYEITAQHATQPQARKNWEAAQIALQRAINALDATAAKGPLNSIERADLNRAQGLSAAVAAHLTADRGAIASTTGH